MHQQFNNPANPSIHERTTVRKIMTDTDGKLDCFISGVGTGGTLTVVGKVLKKEITDITVIAVEPEESPFLSKREKGSHKIQGIGAGFVPNVLEKDIIDLIMTINYKDASNMSRLLASKEGIFVGISSGAAVSAALKYAEKYGPNKRILAILPDTGERYLSTDLFD